ncbi:MPT63 family protein [Mycolicibacterium tusciae]|uniref:MPT63 family protein n=1 Tax=Mycolicibacterium tusciae TaxID=75922 RepID=UPI00024A1B17|nr:MPT63 family protein [Mycolicibacterium tusciae]
MKIKAITTVLATTATIGIIGAPIVSADTVAPPAPSQITSTTLGSQAKVVDGAVVQGWTISDLKPSSDAIPHPVSGTLWEATATDEALEGSATPIVSNLNARAQDGQTYRVLFGVATPQGVNPSTLVQGQATTGKVYFDVTGSTPESVVYNAGGQDLALWVKPAPSTSSTGSPSYSNPSGSYASESPATAPTPAQTPAAPAAADPEAVPPAGSQGTPLPAGSQGTPLPAGSQGTPLPPAGSQGTPLPAGSQGTPLPASSEGTPVPAGSQVPTSTTSTPAPTP